MATQQTTITGLKELDDMLKSLPAKVEGNVMRGALRAGQQVVLKGAQEELRAMGAVDSGELVNSLRIKFQRRSLKRGWVRVNLTAGNAKAWYSHFIEYGTASYYQGKGSTVGKPYKIKPTKKGALLFGRTVREEVTHPGVRPRPFMRRAIDKHQQGAIDATVEYIRKRLPKEFKKVGR